LGRGALPLASSSDGTWREFNLLQVIMPLAAYDPTNDRLLSIGGSRFEDWALTLAGSHQWQPLPALVPAPYMEPRTSAFDASTGLVYFLGPGVGVSLAVSTLDPATGAVSIITASGEAPAFVAGPPVYDPVNQRILVYASGFPDSDLMDARVWALDLLPS